MVEGKYNRKTEIVNEALKHMELPYALAFADIRMILEEESKFFQPLAVTIKTTLEVINNEKTISPDQLLYCFLGEYYNMKYKKHTFEV
jgi:hypothetical protein